MSSPTFHDILEVVIGLDKCRIENDALKLDADLVLLLEFRPNSLDHNFDALRTVVDVNKSIILCFDILVLEDPWMVQELLYIHPSGFITLKS